MEKEEKPDVLNIKKERNQPVRFHYNRDERLQLRSGSGLREPASDKTAKKRINMVIILSVFIIILIILIFVFR